MKERELKMGSTGLGFWARALEFGEMRRLSRWPLLFCCLDSLGISRPPWPWVEEGRMVTRDTVKGWGERALRGHPVLTILRHTALL